MTRPLGKFKLIQPMNKGMTIFMIFCCLAYASEAATCAPDIWFWMK